MQSLIGELNSVPSSSTDIEWSAPDRTGNRRARRRQRSLARRRPQPVPNKPLLFEPLEQRFLLSADVFPGLADGLGDLLGGFGDHLEEFFATNDDLQTTVPGVLQLVPKEVDGIVQEHDVIVPTIMDLLRAEVMRGPDGTIQQPNSSLDLGTGADPNLANIARYVSANDPAIGGLFPTLSPFWPTASQAMAAMDLNSDGFVTFAEAYQTLFVGTALAIAEDYQETGLFGLQDGGNGLRLALHSGLGGLSEPTQFNVFGQGTLPFELGTSGVSSSFVDGLVRVSFTLNFEFSHTLPIDLGLQADRLGIELAREVFNYSGSNVSLVAADVLPDADVTAKLSLPMRLFIEVPADDEDPVAEEDFGLWIHNTIHVSVEANEDFKNLDANVGFLGTVLAEGSTFVIDMSLEIEVTDPSSPEHLGFIQDPLPTNNTTSVTAQTALPSSLELQSPVLFEIKIGQNNVDPVMVSVPDGDYANRAVVRDAVQDAVDDAGFDGLLTIGLSADRLQFTLPSTNSLPLGFFNQRFVDSGTLTANLDITFAVDENNVPIERAFNTAFLLSVAGALPRLVTVNTVVEDLDELKDALQVALNDAGLPLVFAGTDGDKLTLTGLFGIPSLEITRSISLDARNLITIEELGNVEADYLFTATPANDNFAIDFTFEVANGIHYDPDDVGVSQDAAAEATLKLNLQPFSLAPGSIGVDPATNDQRLDVALELSPLMEEFLQFNVIGAPEFIGVLGHLKTWLERLPSTTLLSAYEIPFADAVLGDLLPFSQFLQSNFLEDLSDPDNPVDKLIAAIADPLDPDEVNRLAAFANAQDLGKRLIQIGLMHEDDLPVYRPDPANPDAGELTYDVKVTEQLLPLLVEGGTEDLYGFEAPIKLNFDIPPLFDFETDAAIVLQATGMFAATLGLKLGEAGTLTNDTTVGPNSDDFDLRVRTNDALAVTGFDDVAEIFGRLTADASFQARVPGVAGGDWVTVIVEKSETAENRELQDLIDDINNAIGDTALSGNIEARAEGNRIVLVATGGVASFDVRVLNASSNTAATELGLATGKASTVSVGTQVQDVRTEFGFFDFFINDATEAVRLFISTAATAGNNSLSDLVADINAAMLDAFLNEDAVDADLASKVVAARNGDQLVFGAVTTDIHYMQIVPNFAKPGTGLDEPLTAGLLLVAANDVGVDTGIQPAQTEFARLPADESFTVRLLLQADQVEQAVVTVTKAATATNTNFQHLVDDINAAISGTALNGKIVALAAGPNRIALQAVSGDFDEIEIVSVSGSDGFDPRLGLEPGQGVEADLLFRAGKDAPRYFGSGENAEFKITIEGGAAAGTHDVTLRVVGDDANPLSDAITNRSIFALVNDVNRELDNVLGQSANNRMLEASSDGQRLVILAKEGSGITGFSIHDPNDAARDDLKLFASDSVGGAPSPLEANKADLLVYLSDGSVTPVDLSGKGTLEEILNALNDVPFLDAGISSDGTSLRLEDTSGGSGAFFINSVNTSRAAGGLGILAGGTTLLVTEGGDLVIIGDRIGTPALSDRMFVRALGGDPLLSAEISASIVKDAQSLHALLQDPDDVALQEAAEAVMEARLGFLGIKLAGGGELVGSIGLSLNDHPTSDWTLREMFATLSGGFESIQELLSLDFDLQSPEDEELEFAISVQPAISDLFDAVSAPSLSIELVGAGAHPLSLDPTDPQFLQKVLPDVIVDVSGAELLASLQDLSFSHLLAALQALADYLGQFSQFEFLNEEIPVLGVSFNELLGVADRFARAVEEVEANPAGTIQLLEQKIRESFNLPPEDNVFALSLVEGGDMLKVGLDFSRVFGGALDIDLDLSDFLDDFGSLPDFIGDQLRLQGSAGMETNGGITAKFAFGIDLSDPGDVYLFTDESDTQLSAFLRAGTDNLSFVAALGPLGVSIINGLADFDLHFDFKNESADPGDKVKILGSGSTSMATLVGDFDLALGGEIDVTLPVYFPNQSSFAGDITVGGSVALAPGNTLDIEFDFDIDPSIFDLDFANFSLFDNLLLLIDGIDVALSSIQALVEGKIFRSMPLIGDPLANSALFIEDFRNEFVQPFRDLVTATPQFADLGVLLVQDFLFDVLEPTTLLRFLDGNEASGADLNKPHSGTTVLDLTDEQREARGAFLNQFIMGEFNFDGLDLSQHFVQWDFVLGQTFEPDLDFAFDIGIPALGLKMDADLEVRIGWELGLGLGLSFAQGIYIDVDRKQIDQDGFTEVGGQNYRNFEKTDTSIPELRTVVLAGFNDVDGSNLLEGQLGFLQVKADTKADAFSSTDLANPFGVSGIANNGTGVFASFDIDILNRHNQDAARMGFMDLGGLDAKIQLDAQAKANLELAVGFNENLMGFVAPVLPKIIADFEFDWGGTLIDGSFSGGIDVDFGGHLQTIAFHNVGIDLGSFFGDVLGPFVAPIQEFTAPLQPIIDIVTAPIPVLTQLAGKPVTLVDLAAQFGEFDPRFIYAVADIISLVNSIPSTPGPLVIPLGSFTLFSANGSGGAFGLNQLTNANFDFTTLGDDLFDGLLPGLPDFTDAGFLDGLGGQTGNTFNKLMTGGFNTSDEHGFRFPIFQDPSQIFGLLLGRDAIIIDYNMAPFVLDFEAEMRFMIYGPLWGLVTLGLGLEIDLAFGYDTFGIRKFAAGDFQNPLDLIAGFFFHDHDPITGAPKHELTFSGSIGVGAELNAGVASAGVTANIILSVFFDLHDPNSDGKVRLDEIAQTFLYELRTGNPALAPIAIFDVSGEVALQLKAFLKILFAKFTFNITPPIVLFEFSIDFEREPILATERGDGSLLLHVGPQAENRLHGDLRDIGEWILAEDAGSGQVRVWAPDLGVPQSAAQVYNANRIVAYGGEGDDIIDLSGVSIPVEIYGGPGDDELIGGSGGGIIDGGTGDDVIRATAGNFVLIGGPGNDTIHGGTGNDAIFGDDAIITDRMVFVSMGAKDGQDVIYTGLGNNLVFGGGNHDRIYSGNHGGGAVDNVDRTGTERNVIFGNGGRVALSNPSTPHQVAGTGNAALLGLISLANLPGGGNNVIHGGEGGDLIYGGSGNDLIFAHEGDDLVFGGDGFNIIFGGPGDDELHGGNHDDIIIGGAGNDEIHGGRGNDMLFGDYGEILRNSEGRIVAIRSEPGPGDLGGEVIEGSDGEKVTLGSDGRWVQIVARDPGGPNGGSGNDTMFGTDGANIMFGGAGNDHMEGGPGFDIMFGGPGNDFIDGGPGSDFIFGDTGLVAYFDFANVDGPLDLGGHKHKLIGDAPLPGVIPEHDNRPLTYDLLLAPVRADDGNDFIIGGAGNNIVFGGGGEDTVFGDFDPGNPPDGPIPAGDDILFGDGGWIEFFARRVALAQTFGTDGASDTIFGQGGNDLIFGGAGNNVLHGDHDGDHKFDDDGSDIIVGNFGLVRFISSFGLGDEGFAFRTFGGAAYLIETTDTGHGGHDTIFGRGGNDILIGHEGDDEIHGSDGSNIIVGDHGRVVFVLTEDGNTGPGDTPAGDPRDWPYIAWVETIHFDFGGKDEIFGSANDDLLMGGADDDTIHANAGNNVALGDNGEVIFRTAEGLLDEDGELLGGYAFVMFGGAAQFIRTTDVENATGGEDTIFGGPGDDIIAGGAQGDEIHGNDGNNIILGDNVEIEFDFASTFEGNPWPFLARIETEIRSPEPPNNIVGGADLIFGGMDDDIIAGGADGDEIHGTDGNNIIAGDNVRFLFVPLHVTSGINPDDVGDDLVAIFGAALRTLETTDTETETGGADIIFGSPESDIIVGGVDGDFLFGTSGLNLILGDQALLIWGYDPEKDGLADLVTETLFSDHAQPELGFDSFEGGVTQLHIVKTKDPTLGGRDLIVGGPDDDVMAGGTDSDIMFGGPGGNNTMFGDHAVFYPQHSTHAIYFSRNFFSIDTGDEDGGAGDIMFGGPDNDLMIGGQGDDVMFGSGGHNDMIGGHNVAGGIDELSDPAYSATGSEFNDIMFAGDGHSVMAGDNAIIWREEDFKSPRFWTLGEESQLLYLLPGPGEEADTESLYAAPNFGEKADDPTWVEAGFGRFVHLLDHDYDIEDELLVHGQLALKFGNDVMAGGPGDDMIFGQLGNDIIQGDGEIAIVLDEVLIALLQGLSSNISDNSAVPAMAEILVRASELVADLEDFLEPLVPPEQEDPGTDGHNFAINWIDENDPNNPVVIGMVYNVFEAHTDGNDYIEGGGGSDLVFGGLGQDDIIGGSSNLFGLTEQHQRPDGTTGDFFGRMGNEIYGGAGERLERNEMVGDLVDENGALQFEEDELIAWKERHARDADVIIGNNANIYRFVSKVEFVPGDESYFLSFEHDKNRHMESDRFAHLGFGADGRSYNGGDHELIIVRAFELLDYRAGVGDTSAALRNGGDDLIHGESGDDIIHGMMGNDVIFGGSEDDDIYGGTGNDWISGGTGNDGILGADGLILTSRNMQATSGQGNQNPGIQMSEPLYGIEKVDEVNKTIRTPGDFQIAVINRNMELKKAVQLFAFQDDGLGEGAGNDIVFGGWGNDFIHGGDGDDALSGAEALPGYYTGELNWLLVEQQRHTDQDIDDKLPWHFDRAPFNPGNILQYNPDVREFRLYDEHDPWRKTMLDAEGNLAQQSEWVDEAVALAAVNGPHELTHVMQQGSGAGTKYLMGVDEGGNYVPIYNFLLNFDAREGLPETDFPDTHHEDGLPIMTDGNDRIFGDLGNDWIVGGTGRDHLWGGRGDDMLNMDDDHDTTINSDDPLANNKPDPYQAYADIAYGGAGLDRLILNTGADRAIDWVGEFNSYVVPFSPFGAFQISRALLPHLQDFLYELSWADGADQTIPDIERWVRDNTADARIKVPDPDRNYEPYGEIGLVLQRDADWNEQTGAPQDPQPGNLIGPRDVMRREMFSETDPQVLAFGAEEGTWTLGGGVYTASADLGGEAISLYFLNDPLPSYAEILVTVNIEKGKAGFKENAYIIFDYHDATNFKFAGISSGTDKIQIGQRTEAGWQVLTQSNLKLWDGRNYDLGLVLHGTVATILVNGKNATSYAFDAPLNEGYLALGSDNSTVKFDDFQIQVLPPVVTYAVGSDFSESDDNPFAELTGAWSVDNGRYLGTATGGPALAVVEMDVSPASMIEIETRVGGDGIGGVVFDYRGPDSFKVVLLDASNNKILIGHQTDRGFKIATSAELKLSGNSGHTLLVSLMGGGVSASVNGTAVIGQVYYSLVTSGDVGLIVTEGTSWFDEAEARTNDGSYVSDADTLMAMQSVLGPIGTPMLLTQDQLGPIAVEAYRRLEEVLSPELMTVAFADLSFEIVDLPESMLALVHGHRILVDATAAGHGWFVDTTPRDDAEFRIAQENGVLVAVPSSDAHGSIDLLTVLMHEVAHVFGFDHDTASALMDSTLETGTRVLPSTLLDGGTWVSSADESAGQALLAPVPSSGAHGSIDLLTMSMHDVVHVHGFDHDSASALMDSKLETGTRVLPSTLLDGGTSLSSADDFAGQALLAQSPASADVKQLSKPQPAPALAPGMVLFDLHSGNVEVQPLPDAARPATERSGADDEDFTIPASPRAVVFDTKLQAHKSTLSEAGEEDEGPLLTFDLIRSPLTSGVASPIKQASTK